MVWRKVSVILVTVATVAFTTSVVLLVGLPRPAEIPPPLEGGALQFEVLRPSYQVGEKVTFTVTSYLNQTVYLTSSCPWQVQRFFEGEWKPVEVHACLLRIVTLQYGEPHPGGWTAETAYNYQDQGLLPVEPGSYRVLLRVQLYWEGWRGSVTLSTYFQLV